MVEDEYPPRCPFTTPLELSLVEMVHGRCESWRNTVNVVIDYVGLLLELERQKERGYRKAAALLGPSHLLVAGAEGDSPSGFSSKAEFPRPSITTTTGSTPRSPRPSQSTALTGANSAWLVPLQAFALKGNGESESLVRYMDRAMLPELQQLREAVKLGTKSLREQLGFILTPLHKAYEAMHEAMEAHQTAFASLLSSPTGRHDGGAKKDATVKKDVRYEDGTDPWILQVRLALRMRAYLSEKTVFSQALQSVHDKQRGLDEAWSRALQKSLAEFFTIAAKSAQQMSEQMSDIAQLLGESGRPDAEWTTALQQHRLDYNWNLEVPPFDGFYATVHSQQQENVGVPFQDFAARKCGFLLKQSSGGFGSKSWHALFFVLADSGFLHGYAVDKSQGPSAHGILSHKALQDLNGQVALYAQAYLPEAFLETPAVSIWLGGGHVAAVIADSSSSKMVDTAGCVFTVTSGPLASGGFLFGGRGEKKYSLQSYVEEDMVDWIIALKQTIEHIASSDLTYEANVPGDSNAVDERHAPTNEPVESNVNYAEYENQSVGERVDDHQYGHNDQHYDQYDDGGETPSLPRAEYKLPPELEKNPWED